MRRSVGILSMAVVPVFVASLAFADDPGRYGGKQGATSGAAAAGFVGQHMMTGTVTDIDKEKGRLTVEADGEELDLHFPKTAIQNLDKGDRVTVQLAIKPAGSGATSGAGAAPTGGMGRGSKSGTREEPGSGPAGSRALSSSEAAYAGGRGLRPPAAGLPAA